MTDPVPAVVPENLVRLAGSVVGVVSTPMAAVDGDLRVIATNAAFDRMAGLTGSPVGIELLRLNACRWDAPDLQDAMKRILPEDRAFTRCPAIGVDGRPMLVSGSPLRPDDRAASMMLLTFDSAPVPAPGGPAAVAAGLTDSRVIEIAHRVKNLLALVQSLAIQTRGADIESYRRAFLSRLKALALAYGTMLETSLDRAPLRGLLHELLAPFIQDAPDRVVMDGPPVALSAHQVTIFALIVHELASNAARHGALSRPDGRVFLAWQVDDGDLSLTWREESPDWPATAGEDCLQDHEGFGTILIRRAASYQLHGSAELEFGPDGFVCALNFPLKGAE